MGRRATSEELIHLGNRIRERRREMRLSQEALAEQVGISSNTISRIEGGQTAMSVEIFKKLVRILKIDANTLLDSAMMFKKESGQINAMFDRVIKLKDGDQDIVMQTMRALMDGLGKNQ